MNQAQTTQLYPVPGGYVEKKQQDTYQQRVLYTVSQVAYKPRRLGESQGPKVIDFVVDGVDGIRLSDALKGNWTGFEGRDDRSLFGRDRRSQIILRFQVRPSVRGCHQRN